MCKTSHMSVLPSNFEFAYYQKMLRQYKNWAEEENTVIFNIV